MIITVTGHRKISADVEPVVQAFFRNAFNYYDVDSVIQGQAPGVDIIAGEVALECGKPLICAVPYDGHDTFDKAWTERWHNLVDNASEVITVSPGPYAAWKFHARNHWMVNHGDLVLSVWDKQPKGGTAACIKYAIKRHKYVLNLNPIPKGEDYWMEVLNEPSTT